MLAPRVVCPASGKTRYSSKAMALRVMSRIHERKGHRNIVFECPQCGRWHIAKSKPKPE